jgi:hypothetical protein
MTGDREPLRLAPEQTSSLENEPQRAQPPPFEKPGERRIQRSRDRLRHP